MSLIQKKTKGDPEKRAYLRLGAVASEGSFGFLGKGIELVFGLTGGMERMTKGDSDLVLFPLIVADNIESILVN